MVEGKGIRRGEDGGIGGGEGEICYFWGGDGGLDGGCEGGYWGVWSWEGVDGVGVFIW